MRRYLASFVFVWLVLSGAGLLAQQKAESKDSQVKAADQQPATTKPVRQTRLRFGGFAAGGYWSSSPYWYLYYFPYSYAASYGWSPYWWGPYPSFYPSPYWTDSSANGGKVKIDSSRDDAEVFIDGAYAGVLKDLKSIPLAPGAYNLELRAEGMSSYQKRIYVLSGKTVNIAPVFQPAPEAKQ